MVNRPNVMLCEELRCSSIRFDRPNFAAIDVGNGAFLKPFAIVDEAIDRDRHGERSTRLALVVT